MLIMMPAHVPTEAFVVALVIYREAAGESDLGKIAVAATLRNRVEKPKWWGKDFYSVATARYQYSALTVKGDAMTVVWPSFSDPVFQRCIQIASGIIEDTIDHPFPGADSYFNPNVVSAPGWATEDRYRGKIGNHVFYDVDKDVEFVAR